MDTKKSKLVTLTDEELEKATGGAEQNNGTGSTASGENSQTGKKEYPCFVWKGVTYCTMADLRNAMAMGIITEEEAIIIGNEIGGPPN